MQTKSLVWALSFGLLLLGSIGPAAGQVIVRGGYGYYGPPRHRHAPRYYAPAYYAAPPVVYAPGYAPPPAVVIVPAYPRPVYYSSGYRSYGRGGYYRGGGGRRWR